MARVDIIWLKSGN